MTDSTWIRAYNGKNIYTEGVMNSKNGFQWNGQSLDSRYAAASHTHNYIPLSGSTGVTGTLRSNSEIQTTSQNAFRAVTSELRIASMPSSVRRVLAGKISTPSLSTIACTVSLFNIF